MKVVVNRFNGKNDLFTYERVSLINYDIHEVAYHRYQLTAYFESCGDNYAIPVEQIVSIEREDSE